MGNAARQGSMVKKKIKYRKTQHCDRLDVEYTSLFPPTMLVEM